ncbi:MAG: hypothetical protein NTW19_04665 [Planctomycetota bacterium]|nr:hypothetical protein [Planctomycetota bacterium]
MQLDRPIEALLCEIASLDRTECVEQLRSLPRPAMDFTDEYLAAMSLERLRHTLAAACIQARKPMRRSPREASVV